MGFTIHSCVVPTCDDCGDGWSGGEEGPFHFGSAEEAELFLTDHLDWKIIDGRLVCDRCWNKRECLRLDHDWYDWHDGATPDGQVPYRARHCQRCDASQFDPPVADLVLLSRVARIIDRAGS